MKFAEAARGGDHVHAVFNDVIHALLEVIHRDRRGGSEISRVRRRKRGHHRHHTVQIFASHH